MVNTFPIQSTPVDDMDTLIATHRIQRGLSRVSIRKRKPTEMSKLEQLQLKGRDLQQDLKDKHFQLRCIEQLLDQDITNDVSDELYSMFQLTMSSEHTRLVRRSWKVCRANRAQVS